MSVSEKSGICFGWSLREQNSPFFVQRGDKVDFWAFRNLDHNFMAFHCVNFAVQKCVWTSDKQFLKLLQSHSAVTDLVEFSFNQLSGN